MAPRRCRDIRRPSARAPGSEKMSRLPRRQAIRSRSAWCGAWESYRTLGRWVDEADGDAVGFGDGVGVADGRGVGVGLDVPVGVALGVGEAAGVGVGVGASGVGVAPVLGPFSGTAPPLFSQPLKTHRQSARARTSENGKRIVPVFSAKLPIKPGPKGLFTLPSANKSTPGGFQKSTAACARVLAKRG